VSGGFLIRQKLVGLVSRLLGVVDRLVCAAHRQGGREVMAQLGER
jgi:hypothetical protein